MAKKKKPKKLTGGVARYQAKKAQKKSLLQTFLQPRFISMCAFGLSGFLGGLATGLNHFPDLHQTEMLPQMMMLGAYLGDPHVDLQAGLLTAFSGLIMGVCLGFSLLSEPKELALSVLISGVLAFVAFSLTGQVALLGLAFLAGHMPTILKAQRAS